MDKIKKPLGALYKTVNVLFWLLGGVTACVSFAGYFYPEKGIGALEQLITVLEKRLPQERPPSVEFLEFWQSYDGEAIGNTMLRYHNPSPAGAVENAKIAIYHKAAAGVYEVLFEEAQPYLAAESARDIYDIKTSVKIGGDAALCVEYAGGRATLAPLAPENTDGMVVYRLSGPAKDVTDGGCMKALSP